MKITPEMVDYISELSRLRLSDSEREKMTGELEQILAYMDVLNGIDTDGVEPVSHIFPIKNVLRDDVVEASFDRAELLRNASWADTEIGRAHV